VNYEACTFFLLQKLVDYLFNNKQNGKMVRPKKYKAKAEIVSFSCDPDIIRHITENSKKANISRSDYINQAIKAVAYSDVEFARMKMKQANSDFYYWKGKKELWESEKHE